MTDMQDDELTALLAAAKTNGPAPSAALLDRVLADGLHLQPKAPPFRAPQPAPRLWARVAGAFGGAPTLAGLCSATIIGIAVGYVDPTAIDYLTGGLSDSAAEAVDLFPTTDFMTTEG
jgi:hypothetical protein